MQAGAAPRRRATEPDLCRRFAGAFHGRRVAAREAGRLAYGQTEREAREFWRNLVFEVFSPFESRPARLDPLFDRLWDHFARAEAWRVFDDVEPLLAAVEARGLPVVLVSNWDARLPLVLDRTGLASRVAGVVDSYAVGAEKPDPHIFDVARTRFVPGLAAARILHVGDSLDEDVVGARTAGLQAVHLDRRGAEPPAPWRIRTQAELYEPVTES